MAWPSSLEKEAYGMWKELGHRLGVGSWFRRGGGVVKSLLPDGKPSARSTQEEVTLALRHYNVGTLHGSQLSRVGGVPRRRGLETRRTENGTNTIENITSV